MIECFKCGQQNESNSKYCIQCGTSLATQKSYFKIKFYEKSPPRLSCPMCGAEGEENFSRATELISKQSIYSSSTLQTLTCKKCHHVQVHRDHYL